MTIGRTARSRSSVVRPIREIVGIRPHPAVVRLEDLEQSWVSDAFHLTEDVRTHLAVLRRLLAPGETTGAGIFLIGHYGSGKSHFLAYVAGQVQSGAFVDEAPDVAAISLVNFRSTLRLEDIVADALGIEARDGDRRVAWSERLARSPSGLLLVIDELSEFLRSKPDQRAFNEDVRYLQFLGELTQSARITIVAAMQESIEHTGDLEVALYRKIKDRYRIRFQLSVRHVAELVSESILIKAPGYEDATAQIARDLRKTFPEHPEDDARIAAVYPLHPATLDLLEEIRGRFSQARGIVDFALVQLGGSEPRSVSPFLDRPLGEMLGPDAIVDHFRDLLETQPEFLPLAERVLPYFDKHALELFEADAQRALARRIINLLILVYLSPRRGALTADEAAYWLLFKGTRIAPDRNIRIVANILETLVERGRYVRREGDGAFALDLEGDDGGGLDTLLAREVSELSGIGPAVFTEIVAALPADAFNPLVLQNDTWLERTVTWHFHDRTVGYWLGDGEEPRTPPSVVIRLPWGDRRPAPGSAAVIPETIDVGPDAIELVALLRLRDHALSRKDQDRLERRLVERATIFARQLRASYAGGAMFDANGARIAQPPSDRGTHAWLDELGRTALRRTYPSFESHAPLAGPLPQDAHRRFMAFAKSNDLTAPTSDEVVDVVREAYLVPLKLLKRDRGGYVMAPRLDRHELVQLVTTLAEAGTTPSAVYDRLAAPVFGLVPDQIQALLGFLVARGAIDILKGSRSYRDAFETLSSPLKYDRVVSGGSLSLEELHRIQRIMEAFGLRVPEHWTIFAQHRAADVIAERSASLARAMAPLVELDVDEELAARIRWLVDRLPSLAGSDKLGELHAVAADATAARRLAAEVAQLRELPGRIEKLRLQVSGLLHWVRHPEIPAVAGAEELKALPPPPSYSEGDAVERWLERARAARARCVEAYAEAHARYWSDRKADPGLSYAPPPLAASKHAGLGDLVEEIGGARAAAKDQVCPGLSNLEYEPRCRCGFDGHAAPIDRALERSGTLRRRLDDALARFFADDTVRQRMATWGETGPVDEATSRYLRNEAMLPGITDVELLDRHLSGLEAPKEVELDPLIELLTRRTWEADELKAALGAYVDGLEARRLRFSGLPEASRPEVAAWCVEQALRFGVPLPQGLDLRAMEIDPPQVSLRALDVLDELGLPDRLLRAFAAGVVDGAIEMGETPPHSVVARAARDVVDPEPLGCAKDYAALVGDLLRAHPILFPAVGARWLDHLDARASLSIEAPSLEEVVKAHTADQWIVLDAWAAFLHAVVDDAALPGRRRAKTDFALGPRRSTTNEFNTMILETGHPFEKVDVIDDLIHTRTLSIDDLARVAAAELRPALRRIAQRLDPDRPVLVFADHGFRLSRDGRGYTHGGPSTLERLVPVVRLK